MIRHNFPLQKHLDKPLVIMPIGDIQWTGKNGSTALTLLQKRIALGMELGAYFIGTGDFVDFASPSNRQRLRSAALYDTALNVIDDASDRMLNELFDLVLKPTVGRWLGLLEGHHFHEFTSGDTSDQRLCQKLKAPFLGTSAYIGLTFVGKGKKTHVNVWATHGCGGGASVAAPVNKLYSIVPHWEADIFIMAHMTKMASAPLNRVYPVWGRDRASVNHKTIQLVGAGGFSKGYEVGTKQGRVPRGSYVEQEMMKPAALGNPIIRIQPVHKHDSTILTEITVEL